MNRAEILDTAKGLICGKRRQIYGEAADDFGRTGKLWEQILGVPVSAHQVAICLALVKVSRLCETPNHEDSWVDGAGYLALGGEIAVEGIKRIHNGMTPYPSRLEK